MKILALVTARGGSVRLPGKNLRPLGGKPLINWSIETAQDIPEICEILVSTDNESIADVSRQAGALVPWLRPQELSTSEASSVDVALHALNWYEAEKGIVDGLLLLQPTSPFRTRNTVLNGIALYKKMDMLPVVGVSATNAHPLWAFRIENGEMLSFVDNSGIKNRSQDLPPAYIVNGNFYLSSPTNLRENNSFFGPRTIPLIVESEQEALDIDTEIDFAFAEFIYKNVVQK
jgi:CMP-N,N'-diacetyllegionaminic acid synthase